MTEKNNYQPLTEREAKKIANKFFEVRAKKGLHQNSPVAVLIAGQSGAGKTEAAIMVKKELRERGGVIHIDADRMREELPLENQKFPSEVTQSDAAKLVGILRERTVSERRNFIEEGTFKDREAVGKAVDTLNQHGYQVEMVAVAASFEQSLLGIYQRYEMQIEKGSEFPRLVPEEYHKTAFDGFTEMLETQAEKFSRLRIVSRSGEVLFDSNKDSIKNVSESLNRGRHMNIDDLEKLKTGWAEVKQAAKLRNERGESYLSKIVCNSKRVESLHRMELYKPQNQSDRPEQQNQTHKIKNRLR